MTKPVLVANFKKEDERIAVWQYGPNDFAVYYLTSGVNVRGTFMEVMIDLQETYRVFDK